MFEERGREMAPSNLRQADAPEGAETIKEMPGTAPGLICPVGDQVIYAVPGVPHEMRSMLEGSVLPDLKRRAGVTSVIRSRVLKTWGYTESGLADLLSDTITKLDESGQATLAFQASGIEGIKVRITAKGPDDDSVGAILAEVEDGLRPLLGHYLFGIDDQTMESVVLDRLAAKGQTLAIAETLTAGLATHRLAQAPNASRSFKGGQTLASRDLLNLPKGVPWIGEEAATSMASAVRDRFAADIGLAATGKDDRTSERDDLPLGTVYLAVAMGDGVDVTEIRLPGDGRRVRQYAVISLLNMLRLRL